MSVTSNQPGGHFPTTHWSLVAQADHRESLEQLLHQYQPPLLAHLTRTRRMQRADADDLLQSFIADKIIQDRLIEHADRRRGRFRSFLLTVLDNYARDAFRRASTACRSSGKPLLSLDERQADPSLTGEAVAPFELAWGREVLRQGMLRMREQCQQDDRQTLWQVFDQRILRPIVENVPPVEYAVLVRELGFRSPGEAHNALVTAKRMFQRTLRDVLASYAASEMEIEQELRELRDICGRAGSGD